jgi:hypothetical protein
MVSEKSILIAAVIVFVGFVAVSLVFEDFGVTTDDERIRDGCLNGHGAAIVHDHVYLDIWIADENGDLQQIAPLENIGAGTTDNCMKFVHTHDARPYGTGDMAQEVTAYLHVETPFQINISMSHWFMIWDEEFPHSYGDWDQVDDTHEIVVTRNGEVVEDFWNEQLNGQDDFIRIEYRQI